MLPFWIYCCSKVGSYYRLPSDVQGAKGQVIIRNYLLRKNSLQEGGCHSESENYTKKVISSMDKKKPGVLGDIPVGILKGCVD